jgi:tetratricopeptide (TPR) repeat protein
MTSIRTCIATAALVVAGVLPAGAQQPQGPDVLAQPAFKAIAQDLSPAEGLQLAAHINIVLRQYERAIPMFEALLKTLPNRADLWAGLAIAYNRAGEPREAYDAANIAVTLAPHYPHYYAERGIAAFFLGRYAVAIADLSHYVKAFPLHANAHFYLGLAQAARGEAEAAQASLLRARRLNPDLALSANYFLGLVAAERGQVARSRQLLAELQQAFNGSGLPIGKVIAEQVADLDGAVAQRLRAATHEADARAAPLPHLAGSPVAR